MELFNSRQICNVLDTVSIDQSVLSHVHDFQFKTAKNPEFIPEKKLATCMADRRYNLAVTAFMALSK